MKLNPDCVRDILLSVEETTDVYTPFVYERNSPSPVRLIPYPHNVIHYHIRQCEFSGLLMGYSEFSAGCRILVSDLSPAGHEFLANIRNDSVWEKIKGAASATCGNSLRGIAQIAQAVMIEIIKQYLGVT